MSYQNSQNSKTTTTGTTKTDQTSKNFKDISNLDRLATNANSKNPTHDAPSRQSQNPNKKIGEHDLEKQGRKVFDPKHTKQNSNKDRR